MTRHPGLGMLADYVMNVKALDVASRQHVESCAHCRADLRWLEQLGALREFEPPDSAVEPVLNEFRKMRSGAA